MIALTNTFKRNNTFFTGALWFGQEPASGVAAHPEIHLQRAAREARLSPTGMRTNSAAVRLIALTINFKRNNSFFAGALWFG